MRLRRKALAFSLVIAPALGACQTTGLVAPAPRDFAAYEGAGARGDGVVARAVSSRGVVYRVRSVPHEPKAELAFWKEALARKLEGDGYLVLSTEDIRFAGRAGAVIHAVAPLADGDYGFVVAFAPDGDRVVLAESAGPQAALAEAKPAVMEAIARLTVE